MSKKIFEYRDDINGKASVLFSWSQDNNFVACAGDKQIIYILDKRGKKLKDIGLQQSNKVLQLEWDKDNETICIVMDGVNFVFLWQVFASNALVQLDMDNAKSKASWAKWSKSHPVLAIGTDKGGLIFYYKKNQKKVPTMGKHGKKIISGDWNKEGLLITGGEDKIITVSNFNSESLYESITVKAEPRNIQWARSKTDEREVQQRSVTAVIQQKTILMFELGKNHKYPFELQFEQKYGKIVDYSLFGDGYIVVGFSEGYVAHISTHMKEIRDEVQSEKIFNASLDALCTNDALYKLAAAGENCIKIYNMSTWKEIKNERIDLPPAVGRVSRLSFSSNGQILIVSTSNGFLLGFLTSIPTLTAVCGSLLALQTSFTEVMVTETSKQQLINITNIQLETEPSFISLSQQYFTCGVNNVVWYYQWLDLQGNKVIKGGRLVQKKDYLGYVQQQLVNEKFAAVLSDGKCTLHCVDPTLPDAVKLEKTFPQGENEKQNLQIGLTKFFLILLDEAGKIRLYHLQDQTFVVEYNNDLNIQKIFPNLSGTRIVALNNKNQGYLFESSTETMFRITGFPEKAEKVLWDQRDTNLFSSLEGETMLVFLVNKNNLYGESVAPVPELLSLEALQSPSTPVTTILDKGLKALSIVNGFLKCYTPAGTVQSQYLASHSYLNSYKGVEDNQEGHFRYYLQNMALLKYSNALIAATNLKNVKLFDILGRKCLENMELDVAIKSFQQAQNVSMVMMINSFRHEREKVLLFAYVAMILGQYDLSQDLFLKSSLPQCALDLRCDIQDYLSALTLSKQIAPQQEPYICKRLAIQIETQGNNPEALKLYERAVLKDQNIPRKELDQHNTQCFAGIARTSIKMGDIIRGQTVAREIRDLTLVGEIAMVCENMKQTLEAAELYEQAGILEKAASLYISMKMFKQAAPLMNKIKSPKLLSLYAKSKESEGSFKDAEAAYEKAEDWESVVRLNLNQLDNIEKAKFVLRNKCQTANIAAMVATTCDKRGSKAEAVEFLIMAGKKEEAFTLAQTHGEMEVYAEHMKAFSLEERLRVASYFEGKSQWDKAALHYDKAQNPLKALKLYEEAGEDFIQDMVDLVARNKSENLIQSLLDYLMGEKDNYPKDPNWTYKLYRQLGNYKAAARIAITIAGQEQEQGNYKQAHIRLFETCDDFITNNIQQPYDLQMKLLILHSYVIVKRVIKAENHEDAAKLLDRVCKNISQFPSHAVNILTSAVIEAIRANLKLLAYQWSVVLMRPDYRPQINERYRNKIENIARKPVKEEADEVKTPCPFCQEYVPEFQNDCPKCQNFIPFCIASGKHIIHEQTCLCPECKFPAIIGYFRKMLVVENTCPLCNKEINPNDLKEITEEDIKRFKRNGESQQQAQLQQQQQAQ